MRHNAQWSLDILRKYRDCYDKSGLYAGSMSGVNAGGHIILMLECWCAMHAEREFQYMGCFWIDCDYPGFYANSSLTRTHKRK